MAKSFVALVVDALKAHNGQLNPEVYTKLTPTGDNPHAFIERVANYEAGAYDATGEPPKFILVSHRGRKQYKVEFNQLVMPADPDSKRRKDFDPTKPQPTNYWPAIVMVTPNIEAAMKSAEENRQRGLLALSEMQAVLAGVRLDSTNEAFKALCPKGEYSVSVDSARPGSHPGRYTVSLTVDLDPTRVIKSADGTNVGSVAGESGSIGDPDTSSDDGEDLLRGTGMTPAP